MVVVQIGLHFRAVISEDSLVFCSHIFTLVAAIQNEEDFKLGLGRVSVHKLSRSPGFRIWEVRDQNLTAALFTYIFCSFPQFVQEKGGVIPQTT
jgi:hypothetical protein